MNDTALLWVVTLVGAVIFVGVDVFVIGRRPHEPSMREATRHLIFYIALAVAFGITVWSMAGHRYGTEFFAGWLTEYSLSVDNLFVFLLIMRRFAVPRALQQSALLIGIVLALVLRGVFIAFGAAAIHTFAWVFYAFGMFLIYTAIKLAVADDSQTEKYHEGRLVTWFRSKVTSSEGYHGAHVSVRDNGRRVLTSMALVMVALGTTDLLFALDSIPAIYGLTEEPYLVLTANIFALMGLRQLYFLIGGLLERLVYLSIGLSVLLGFIGVKLVLHAMHDNTLPFINGGDAVHWAPDIPIWVSLTVIVGVLAATTVASLVRTRIDERR